MKKFYIQLVLHLSLPFIIFDRKIHRGNELFEYADLSISGDIKELILANGCFENQDPVLNRVIPKKEYRIQ